MKGEKRQLYRDLITLTVYGLCNFCQYSRWEGDSCCESYPICVHAILKDEFKLPDVNDVWSGGDCWGFRPDRKFEDIGKFVGICLEGNMPRNVDGELVAVIPSQRDREYGLV